MIVQLFQTLGHYISIATSEDLQSMHAELLQIAELICFGSDKLNVPRQLYAQLYTLCSSLSILPDELLRQVQSHAEIQQ